MYDATVTRYAMQDLQDTRSVSIANLSTLAFSHSAVVTPTKILKTTLIADNYGWCASQATTKAKFMCTICSRGVFWPCERYLKKNCSYFRCLFFCTRVQIVHMNKMPIHFDRRFWYMATILYKPIKILSKWKSDCLFWLTRHEKIDAQIRIIFYIF